MADFPASVNVKCLRMDVPSYDASESPGSGLRQLRTPVVSKPSRVSRSINLEGENDTHRLTVHGCHIVRVCPERSCGIA